MKKDGMINSLPELDAIAKKVEIAFSVMHIDSNNKNIFYNREDNTSSKLGIQIGAGDTSDLTNYVIFNRSSYGSEEIIKHNTISMHADKDISYESNMLANVMTDDIIEFFDTTEKTLGPNNLKININRSIKTKAKKLSFISRLFKGE